MERTSEIIATDLSNIPTLDTIQDKYDSLIVSEAKKTINILGKKTKRPYFSLGFQWTREQAQDANFDLRSSVF